MTVDPNSHRPEFQAAALDLLGYAFPCTDRELALAALGVACIRAPRGVLDAALREFVGVTLPALLKQGTDDTSSQVASDSANKRIAITKLFEQGPVRIVIDATRDGVNVPPHLRTVKDLGLVIGKGLVPPIPEFEDDDDLDVGLGTDAVHATLSFNQTPYECVIPWGAIWGAGLASSGEGMVFPQSAPEGWRGSHAVTLSPNVLAKPEKSDKTEAKTAVQFKIRPKLSLVPPVEDDVNEPPGAA